jgi:3'-phosphoadenosine 5'-phosphosulfate sulfotransferase (PAPS reductase)/FAD synthetase
MKHIVFYSGGIGSWMTAKRVIEKEGKENVVLLFTDTMIEDEDLYRFIDETVVEMGAEIYKIADGRTPWEVFKDVKWIGNSRVAQCSHKLKQDTAEKWIKANFKPEECILYLGIDWTEEHRTASPKRNWAPYTVEFPMCDEPYVTKDEMLAELEKLGIEIPRLYKMGFSHNNCGGFCVRAGQGHFINLLKTMPERYAHHEEQEQKMREYLGKDVSILRRQRKGVKEYITLKQLREEWEAKNTENIDLTDIGGCGCFVQDID